jgi:hypothetical protein
LRNLSVEAAGASALNAARFQAAIQALYVLKSSHDATTARYAAALLRNLKR